MIVSNTELERKHQDDSLVPPQSNSGFLYFTVFIVILPIFVGGVAFTWTSPVIPKLIDENRLDENPFGRLITASEESWIASILCFGSAVGPFIGVRAVDVIGRVQGLQCFSLPILTSFIILALAKNIYLYYFARLIAGLGIGGVMVILPMYVGEISEDKNRGPLSCWITIFFVLGSELPYAIGAYFTTDIFSYICAAPLLLFYFCSFLFIPESPDFLLLIGEERKAEKSLQKFRGLSSEFVQTELNTLKNADSGQFGFKTLFSTMSLRRALIICAGELAFQQLSGINVVAAYMEPIFDIADSGISTAAAANIIGVLQVLTTILVSFTVDRFGRRLLLIISSVFCFIPEIVIGIYFYLQDVEGTDLKPYGWLLITSFIVYIIAFNLGIGIIPFTMASELFPLNVKLAGNVLSIFVSFATQFLVTVLYPVMTDEISAAWSFWIYGVFCFLSIFFSYYIVPETKGKSLSEIQDILRDGKYIIS